ncbi:MULTISPECIES: DUF485 domain-containing protein [Burkholderia]|uniref:Membrane protein n=1 Tax=Burkholderia lata (strain ATCC 17760 / DSM 23089 / LMG 22485 / NCIMB 9086 / R18194 / 383) TaxID=482957 RepID=A0A6P2IUV0_BURL3|nr:MULTISPECIES: DUF485 domain-containing protein [Burkholderia]MBN3779657.1 DUF485 domain-containing protein [Burkholderia sp. Ac-20345]VWB33544.1 membrane protein [Burkholderia lata]
MTLNESAVSRIREHVKFRELVDERARLGRVLMIIVLGTYFGLIALVALRPDLLRSPAWAGSVTTVGVVFAIAVIVAGWGLTWLYVRVANDRFERLTNELLGEVME